MWAFTWNDIIAAVKIYNLSSQSSRRIGNFKLELRSLSKINHPNVIKCFGAGSIGNGLCLVLERAETTNIWNYVERFTSEWSEKGYIKNWGLEWAELAKGLEAMSVAGVLHTDLQLDNILLFFVHREEKNILEDGEEKSEEDKSKIVEKEKKRVAFKVVSSFDFDKQAVIRGSIRHYAPEAIEAKENYTSASDVYSFGLLLYEMVHAKRVWSTFPTSGVSNKVIQGERPEFEVPCHEKIKEVMKGCWEHDPKKRISFKKASENLHEVYKKLSNT